MNRCAVHVFQRAGGTWLEQTWLEAADGTPWEEFGKSVSADGNLAVVGCPGDDIMSWNSGSAYVFTRQTDALALNNWRLLVAAHRQNGLRGGAFLYEQRGLFWIETGPMAPQGVAAGEQAGWSVALSGREMLLGCPFDTPHGPSSGSGVVFEQGLQFNFGPAGGR